MNGFKQTEIGLIPEDWEVVRLGEVAEVKTGQSAPQGQNYFKNGKYPFIRVQHIDNTDYKIKGWDLINEQAIKDYNLKLFPKGTIIFPKSGATVYLEKRALLPFDAYIVSHLCAINSKNEILNQKFLFYFLINKKLAKKKAEGYPTLNLSEIKEIKLPLPPLEEQQKIAKVLDKIQQAIELQDKIIEETKNLKKSLMKKLFTEGVYGEEQKETEIGLIPKNWEVVRLGKIVKYKKGKKPKILYKKWESKFIPYLTAEYFRTGIPDKFVDIKAENVELVHPEDIVLIWDGSNAGDVFMGLNGVLASTMVKINIKITKMFNLYLYYYLKKNFKLLNSTTTGSTIPHVNKTIFESLPIPLPPLGEQKEIAHILSTVDRKIEIEQKKKELLKELFKTMLHRLMSGEIRLKNVEI